MDKNKIKRMNNNWVTPKWLYDELNKEFNFDFDPCPLQENLIKQDGLIIEWGKSNFVNPPYSLKLKKQFVLKAIEESNKGKTCVLLLPVSTSTELFHNFIQPNAKEIRFIKGRVKFLKWENGKLKEKNNSMHDSMIVVFKK